MQHDYPFQLNFILNILRWNGIKFHSDHFTTLKLFRSDISHKLATLYKVYIFYTGYSIALHIARTHSLQCCNINLSTFHSFFSSLFCLRNILGSQIHIYNGSDWRFHTSFRIDEKKIIYLSKTLCVFVSVCACG